MQGKSKRQKDSPDVVVLIDEPPRGRRGAEDTSPLANLSHNAHQRESKRKRSNPPEAEAIDLSRSPSPPRPLAPPKPSHFEQPVSKGIPIIELLDRPPALPSYHPGMRRNKEEAHLKGPSGCDLHVDEDATLARRLQAAEDRRLMHERAALSRRMNALQAEEEAAAEAGAAQRPTRSMGRRRNPREGAAAAAESFSGYDRNAPPAFLRGGRRGRWARPSSLSFVEAMSSILGGSGDGGPLRGHPFSSMFSDFQALQQAVAGARSGSLPSNLLFSDRDFTEADYEALLALDESVENKKGARQEAIEQLPEERVPRGRQALGDCCICLEGMTTGQTVRRLGCSHVYHRTCVDRWLRQKDSCPVCQRQI